MIKNDKQYAITTNRREEFFKSLQDLKAIHSGNLLNQIMIDSVISQIEIFDKELIEYKILKDETINIIISPIEKLPETLIKARITKGLSQNELAQRTGLKEQQIQRYEACNYESANFQRILNIAKSMDINFEETKAILNQEVMEVAGYDISFLKQATKKLQSRRTMFTI
ncbi:helix-turn-helix domain-containing protein [Flavobacterium sp. FlaQc-47]|uniref:helix-turn-helix domain-containing protein n=1 Tax=Flavobacterium sp. FlaQc-47 TaxID=3374180 RepID=UPI0037573F3F